MTNTKHIDTTMHSYNNNNTSLKKSNTADTNTNTMTRMHPSMKRPRAPIACYRCHHKKVRCDGEHPNCTRCSSTGILCAYPSSRRSRNTQPTNVDPFIDNLSQLEARIRRIETDLESQRTLVRTVCANESGSLMDHQQRNEFKSNNTSRMLKTEKDLQESRSIVAQLRLRGEQRAARGRRAAAAAATAAAATATTTTSSGKAQKTNEAANGTGGRQKANHSGKLKKEKPYTPASAISATSAAMNYATAITSPPFYFTSQTTSTSSSDFINPSPTYYFPPYTTDLTGGGPLCSTGGGSSTQQQFNFQDWPLLNDLPSATCAVPANDFVDPMVIAAAEAHQHHQGIAPPLLHFMVDQDTSIMAARARSLSQLPCTAATMLMPSLRPSSSSTSTCSNSSFGYANPSLYENYSQFMDQNDMMMMDDVGGTSVVSSTSLRL